MNFVPNTNTYSYLGQALIGGCHACKPIPYDVNKVQDRIGNKHKRHEIGDEIFDEALKIMIHGVVIQMFGGNGR
ncbi:MAG: hypothetical protein ACYDEJ_13120 [Desulfitobacteriaceae bacterium]